jgi:hypothetical protein
LDRFIAGALAEGVPLSASLRSVTGFFGFVGNAQRQAGTAISKELIGDLSGNQFSEGPGFYVDKGVFERLGASRSRVRLSGAAA